MSSLRDECAAHGTAKDFSVNNCDLTVIAANLHVQHGESPMEIAERLISAFD